MPNIEHVIESFELHHKDGDTAKVRLACQYAMDKHKDQKRRSGEPYIVHPMSVAKIVADMGLLESSICAAFLHDVVEDTDTSIEEIGTVFGEDVAMLVEGLTKLDNVQFTHREERQAESFRKMLLATVSDIRVLLIKLADRLHNMSTLDALKRDKQIRIAEETRDVYCPLASRLGLAWLKADLDDLSFKYLEPETYQVLFDTVRRTRSHRMLFINKTKRRIAALLGEKGFPDVEVTGRLKNLKSIHMKMKNKDLEFEEVHDAIAFRVICDSVEDCYSIFGIVHTRWVPVPGLIKDYIAMPKPNNYRSLQTTVVGDGGEWMEMQIRTREMHEIAEYGIAAHWAYKEGIKSSEQKLYEWIRGIIDNQAELVDSREFFDSLKTDLLHSEVYVFTPTGEIKTLRAGATPLDFAYAVHTEVGHKCKGAKVNGTIVPFNYTLCSGDYVEIITGEQQHPTAAWLDIVHTSKARNRIKAYLRAEQRRQSITMGQSLLEKALRAKGVSLNRVKKTGELETLAGRHKLQDADDVFAAIGHGKLDEHSVVVELLPEEDTDDAHKNIKESAFEKLIRKVKWQDDGIVIDGVDSLLVRFARCCNPLPGEPVIGYISRGRGIVVHKQGCRQTQCLEKARQTRVVWADNVSQSRPIQLSIIADDRNGILADVTKAFTAQNVGISSIQSDVSRDGEARIRIGFVVDNVAPLQELMRKLKTIRSVQKVMRVG